MSIPTPEILKDALDQAATDHGIYEADILGGVHDAEWPSWYADHMARTLADAGYSLNVPVGNGRTQAAAAQEEAQVNATLELKLEVLVLPVSDVDRAKDFYEKAGSASTPTSTSARSFESSSSPLRARRCRSSSARASPNQHQARSRIFTWS